MDNMKKKSHLTCPVSRPKNDFRFDIVKSVPNETVVALYKAGGWWDEKTGDRKLIPKVVKGSFAFAIAKNKQGKVIGMGRVVSDGFSDAYIQDVVVLPAYRGRRVGEGIIRTLTERCTRKKISWIGLVAEPGTYPFYRKQGFKDKKGFQLMLLDQGKRK